MNRALRIHFPGQPMGKQRHRTGRGHTYTPKKTQDYEEALGWTAKQAIEDQACWVQTKFPFPVDLCFQARFQMPKSWKRSRKEEMRGRYHSRKPDIDNILKIIADSLKGIYFQDDCQIARLGECTKIWVEDDPGLTIDLKPLKPRREP